MNTNNGVPSTQDIINSLPGDKKVAMFTLIGRYRSGQIQLSDFLSQAQSLLGPRLYTQWVSQFPSAQDGTRPRRTEQQARATPSPVPAQFVLSSSGSQSRTSSPAPIGTPFMTPMFPVPAVAGNYASFSLGGSSMPTFKSLHPDQGKEVDLGAADLEGDLGLVAGPTEGTSGADVTQMDTSSLQDVIQYSGVDLKEEAENILRGHEAFLASTAQHVSKDVRGSYKYYLNVNSLEKRIHDHCKRIGLREFHDDCFYVIAFALRDKLARMIESLHHISKHRIEFQRLRFKIRVENDPLKQMLVLQRFLGEMHPISSGAPESGRRESTLSLSTGLSMPSSSYSGGGQSYGNVAQPPESHASSHQSSQPTASSQQHPHSSAASMHEAGGAGDADRASKRFKKQPPSKPPVGKEREDVVIKTKLANVTAMAAAGGPQKSWMMSAATAGSDAGSQGAGTFSTSTWKTNIPIPFTATSTDKDIALLVSSRSITVQDLLFLMENDPYLSRTQTYLSIVDGQK